MSASVPQKDKHKYFHGSFICNIQKLQLSTRKWLNLGKQIVVYWYKGVLCNNFLKDWTNICNGIKKVSQTNNEKKPDQKEYILYDCIYTKLKKKQINLQW